jgi:hypothetical protein
MENRLETDAAKEMPPYARVARSARATVVPATFFSPASVVRHCLATGERCVIEQGPTWEDRRLGIWRFDCPGCGGQHEEDFMVHALTRPSHMTRRIDVAIDVDMGELMHGHHVVAKGLQLRTPGGSVLHYDCLPMVDPDSQPELDMGWGIGEVVDDVGTWYRQSGGGVLGLSPGGTLNWGEKYLGNGIPTSATTLLVSFYQASRGLPEDCYSQSLLVNLLSGEASIQQH